MLTNRLQQLTELQNHPRCNRFIAQIIDQNKAAGDAIFAVAISHQGRQGAQCNTTDIIMAEHQVVTCNKDTSRIAR